CGSDSRVGPVARTIRHTPHAAVAAVRTRTPMTIQYPTVGSAVPHAAAGSAGSSSSDRAPERTLLTGGSTPTSVAVACAATHVSPAAPLSTASTPMARLASWSPGLLCGFIGQAPHPGICCEHGQLASRQTVVNQKGPRAALAEDAPQPAAEHELREEV